MKLTLPQHEARLRSMVHPDQRSSYYKTHVDEQAVDLSTAENMLLMNFFQEKAFVDLGPVTQETLRYPMQYIYGTEPYLTSICQFLKDQWNVSVEWTDVFGGSGVVAGLELLALALFKPGDGVLVPAPLWYGFPWSFSQTAGMRFTTFPISGGVNLTVADVAAAVRQYPNAKLLVLTNPNNPLGTNYPKDLQEQICELFLADPERHVISDEIYACSQVKGSNAFVSALSLDAYKKYPDRIHVTYGLSKDFGLAGFRAGFIISKSDKVQTALHGTNCLSSSAWFSPFVTLNTYMTKRLFLPAPQLANDAMNVYKGLLATQYQGTADQLTKSKIEYAAGNDGAIFFWIDLRRYLNRVSATLPYTPLCPRLYSHDDPREGRLLTYIQQQAHVLLVRGQECFNTDPGHFRLCYTSEDLGRVTMGIDNMVQALDALPGG